MSVKEPGHALGDVKRALRRHRQRLLAAANVLYLGIGEKIRGGKGTGRLSIRVFVSRKRLLPRSQAIPRRLRAVERGGGAARHFIPTDVETAPRPMRALSLRGGDRLLGWRLGSLAVAYSTAAGRSLILTSGHVVAAAGTLGVGRPVRGKKRLIGTVYRHAPLKLHAVNEVDAAVAAARVPIKLLEVRGLEGRLSGSEEILAGSPRRYFYLDHRGRRKTFDRPNEILSPLVVMVGRQRLLFARCLSLSASSPRLPAPGDSGSLLIRERGGANLACGLVFAGGGRQVLVNRLGAVFRALGRRSAAGDGTVEDVAMRFDACLPSLASGQ